MTDLDQHILERVRNSLGENRLAGAIVYLARDRVHAGERVRVGDVLIEVPWEAYIAFVDLEAGANWGHACFYLAIRPDADEVIQVPARMPPFLKAETSLFRFLWRGPLAPEWAVATGLE